MQGLMRICDGEIHQMKENIFSKGAASFRLWSRPGKKYVNSSTELTRGNFCGKIMVFLEPGNA